MLTYSKNQRHKAMPNRPELNDLGFLHENVLAIVVHEAERMLEAQLNAHIASDQRGFTFCGLALTASTAALGAYLALSQSGNHELLLPVASLAIGLIFSATLSLISVWPKRFCLPGNEPKNWLPKTWPENKRRDLKVTRLEQAKILQGQILDNRRIARTKAVTQMLSLAVAIASVAASGLILIC